MSCKQLLRNAILAQEYGYEQLAEMIPTWLRRIGRILARFAAFRSRSGCYIRFLQFKPNAKLLDVGCGNGGFLAVAQHLGWNVFGLEPDPVAAALAKHCNCPVINESIEGFDPGERAYDAITMNHVLEHIAEPSPVLNKLVNALADDGVLVTVTPNPSSAVARVFGASWYGLDPPRHLHIPTVGGLSALFKRLGLETVEFTLPRISHRYALESWSIRRYGRAHKSQSRFVPAAFRIAITILHGVGLEVGEEIVCVARKSRNLHSA